MSKFWKNFIDIILLVFFIFSIFFFLKNLFFSENNIYKISEYERSIEGLKKILQKEKEKNTFLKNEYLFILLYKNLSLSTFAKDYLWLVPKDEAVLLKKKENHR